MEELDEYLLTIKPFFSDISGKRVLEYACFVGDWWKMFSHHSPSSVTAFDPVEYETLYNDDTLIKNINFYSDMVNYVRVGYEQFDSAETFDVVVCAGLLYKLSSPFHLIEDIVNRNPDTVYFETTGHIGDTETIGLLKYDDQVHHRDLNRNNTQSRLPWVVQITPDVVVSAFEHFGYKLDDYMNISCKSRPSKDRVAMMRFKKQ